MPLYEYECESCGARFEVIQKFADAPVEICKQCGSGKVQRLMSAPAIHFKGTGWYITDYAKKGSGGETPSSSPASAASSSAGGSDSGAKPAAATDSGSSGASSPASSSPAASSEKK